MEIIEILPRHTKMKTLNAIDTIFARGVKKGHQEGRMEGRMEGLLEGQKKARMEQLMKIVHNLIINTEHTDQEIASLAETTEDFVAHMREDLKQD